MINALLLAINLGLMVVLVAAISINLRIMYRYVCLVGAMRDCVFMLKGLIGQAIISRTEPRLARVATLLGQSIRVDVTIDGREDQGG